MLTRTISGELAPGFVAHEPIAVVLWAEGDEVVAAATELEIHAFGIDEDEAVGNLGGAIVAHLQLLETWGDKLAPRLAIERERLRALLTTVHA